VAKASAVPWLQSLRVAFRGGSAREQLFGTFLVAPTVAWIGVVIAYPVLLTIWLSVHNRRMVEPHPRFVGLEHYMSFLMSDEFWRQVVLTVEWTMWNLVVIVPIGLLVGVLLNQSVPGFSRLRTWILLPWVFPIVVVFLMWKWMLDPMVGVVNPLLIESGFAERPISFLGDRRYAMVTVSMVNAWRWIPFMGVVALAALKTVPGDLQEAARVDGANPWQVFVHITFPHIVPALSVTVLILIMWLVNMFPPVWLLTQGGPANATRILPVSIYIEAFQLFHMSRAAALSVLLLLVAIVLGGLYLRVFGDPSGVQQS